MRNSPGKRESKKSPTKTKKKVGPWYERQDRLKAYVDQNQERFDNLRKVSTSPRHFVSLVLEEVNKGLEALKDENRAYSVDYKREITHKLEVSNSHSAPIGGIINWCGERGPGFPRGYPGWETVLEIRMKTQDYDMLTGLMKAIPGFNTGNAGWGYTRTTWETEVRFYEQDFPLLRAAMTCERLGIL